jgi:hypothetical protein
MSFRGAKTYLKDGKINMKLRFGEMQENIRILGFLVIHLKKH